MKKQELLELARSRGVRVFTSEEKAADLMRKTGSRDRAIALQSKCRASAVAMLANAQASGKANGFTVSELTDMVKFESNTLVHTKTL